MALIVLSTVLRSADAEEGYTGPVEVRLKYLYSFDVKLSGKPLGWVDQIIIDDGIGEIYILDKSNRRIVVTDIRGGYIFHFDYTLAGLKGPVSLDVDPDTGEFYVAESRRISVLNYRGEFLREVELSGIPGSEDISIQSIRLVRESDGTFLYIGDNKNRRIVVATLQGDLVHEYTDRNRSMGNNITSMHVVGDRIFWLDSTGFAVRSIQKDDGGPVKSFGRISSLLGGFSMPVDMDIDAKRSRIVVVDSNRMMVIVFDMDGNVLFEFGGPRMFSWPRAVAVDARGRIFVADTRGAIRVFEAVPLLDDEGVAPGEGPGSRAEDQ